jgi:hypothetical protein
MSFITHITSIVFFCSLSFQLSPKIPDLEKLHSAIETFYNQQSAIQVSEIQQTKKFRWLSYLPNPGYSPFTGGFTASLNLASPLQEIRITHTQKIQIESIKRNNILLANDLKNSITVDYHHIQNLISNLKQRSSLDSLNLLIYDLSTKKYKSKEITPSEFIASSKAQEELKLSRHKEENAISEAINSLMYKAKMDVPASNAHLNNLNIK